KPIPLVKNPKPKGLHSNDNKHETSPKTKSGATIAGQEASITLVFWDNVGDAPFSSVEFSPYEFQRIVRAATAAGCIPEQFLERILREQISGDHRYQMN